MTIQKNKISEVNKFNRLSIDWVAAVLRLAKILKVHPTEIVPELSHLLPDRQPQTNNLTREAINFALDWQALDEGQRGIISGVLNTFVSNQN